MIEYLKVARVEHWLKNVFIVLGHAVAFVLYYHLSFERADAELPRPFVVQAILSLIPACLLASAYYILNEILDAPFDALHPLKKLRGIPAGKVKVPILWGIMAICLVAAFALGWLLFPNRGYVISLAVLFFCACLYNIPPVRLKDKAFLDVITESFNNPLRLWLGWYAVMPASVHSGPPISIVLAWWFFGALLMTGKRYAEYRFIGDNTLSGQYRKSFKTYTEQRLIIAMITYANLFCFCTGVAMAVYEPLNNLVLVFPVIMMAVIAYFRIAMSAEGAKLEPEKLLQNKWVAIAGLLAAGGAVWLLYAQLSGDFRVKDTLHLMQPNWTPPSASP